MEFSRPEYCSAWPFPFPGDLPNAWRRKWQPTAVFWPGKSHGWRSLVGYSPWSCKELDTTERLHFHFSQHRYRTHVSRIAGEFFTSWATREAWIHGNQLKFWIHGSKPGTRPGGTRGWPGTGKDKGLDLWQLACSGQPEAWVPGTQSGLRGLIGILRPQEHFWSLVQWELPRVTEASRHWDFFFFFRTIIIYAAPIKKYL